MIVPMQDVRTIIGRLMHLFNDPLERGTRLTPG